MIFRNIFVLTLLVLSLAITPNTLARDDYAVSSNQPKSEVRKEEVKNKFTSLRRERIGKFSDQMILRLEANVKRLEKLILRIEERVKKNEEKVKTKDLTKTKASLLEAKTLLSATTIKIDSLKSTVDTLLTVDDPKVAFKKVRESLNLIKDDLKKVHLLLVKAINYIK